MAWAAKGFNTDPEAWKGGVWLASAFQLATKFPKERYIIAKRAIPSEIEQPAQERNSKDLRPPVGPLMSPTISHFSLILNCAMVVSMQR